MIFLNTFISFMKDPQYRDLVMTTGFILVLGTIVYHYLEGWNILDSFYFSFITLTTIGYGDFSPQTNAGKLFTIFYVILGIGIILAFINTVYAHFEEQKKWKKEEGEV